MGAVAVVLAFLAGALAALVAVVCAAWALLLRLSSEDPQPRVPRTPPDPVSDDEVRTWVRLHSTKPRDTAAAASGPQLVASLKGGILFIFQNEKSTTCQHLFNMTEGFTVELGRTHRTHWHRSNSVRLTHPTRRELLPNNWAECFLTFETAKELERWYHLLACAGQPEGQREQQRAREDFGPQSQPQGGGLRDALNALVARAWYALHRDAVVLGALRAKIDKKLSRLKLPPVVVGLRVRDFDIGPHLPRVADARLVALGPRGELEIDADVDYAGGFALALECAVAVGIPMTSKQLACPLTLRVRAGAGSARLRLAMHAPPARCLWFGFHAVPDAGVELSTQIGSAAGAHAQLSLAALPPRVVETIVAKLRAEIRELFVLPNMEDIPIPDPARRARKRAARLAAAELAAADAAAAAAAAAVAESPQASPSGSPPLGPTTPGAGAARLCVSQPAQRPPHAERASAPPAPAAAAMRSSAESSPPRSGSPTHTPPTRHARACSDACDHKPPPLPLLHSAQGGHTLPSPRVMDPGATAPPSPSSAAAAAAAESAPPPVPSRLAKFLRRAAPPPPTHQQGASPPTGTAPPPPQQQPPQPPGAGGHVGSVLALAAIDM
eukprot:m51a1_g6273 hypothetical protein (611) ;mRNA; f:148876-151057